LTVLPIYYKSIILILPKGIKERRIEEIRRGERHAEYGVILWEYRREETNSKNTT
jgi:hypothetical protein